MAVNFLDRESQSMVDEGQYHMKFQHATVFPGLTDLKAGIVTYITHDQ